MNLQTEEPLSYIYTFLYREEEKSLCALEMRSLFGKDTETYILESDHKVDPSRSPFIKERIDVIYDGDNLENIKEQVKKLDLSDSTFKVLFLKTDENFEFTKRREIEREIGLHIPGTANLHNPDQLYAIIKIEERWKFGKYHASEAIWLHHQKKPHNYSTALSTRIARSVVNIAVPNPTGVKVIDPCCGIGTVIIEALSMGINIVGSDNNPLVMSGVRENIAHFGYVSEVVLRDIRNITDMYDVAIIDMPYNLCSVISEEEKLEMLQSARKFTNKMVIITTEEIEEILKKTNFKVVDRCDVPKGKFIRHILVCK